MYEVWSARPARCIARFRFLGAALAYVKSAGARSTVAIRKPDGSWYRDPCTRRSIIGPGQPLSNPRRLRSRHTS